MYNAFMHSPYWKGHYKRLTKKQFYKHLWSYLRARLGFPQLQSLFISPSHQCNANCPHCFERFNHEKMKQSLSTDQIKNIIDQFHDMGGYFVVFCSGEFLLRNDAMSLIRYASSKDISVGTTTNGYLLDKEKIAELKDAGLTIVFVSLDSADRATHDNLRGLPGCFEKAVNGIRLAKAAGLTASIWTYITRSHNSELPGLIKLGEEIGADGTFCYFPLLSGHLFNKFEENFTAKERNALRKKLQHIPSFSFEFRSERDLCSGGGYFHICVMPSGDVTFCPPVPYSYGNIASDTLKDCFLKIRKDYRRFCTKSCRGQCPVNFPEYRKNCNATFMYK